MAPLTDEQLAEVAYTLGDGCPAPRGDYYNEMKCESLAAYIIRRDWLKAIVSELIERRKNSTHSGD